MNLSNVRAELLELMDFDSSWPVVDEAVPGSEIHPPCVLLTYAMTVGASAFGQRMATFTARLLIDPATENAQFPNLMAAIGDGGWVDALIVRAQAASTYWSSLIVDTTVTVSEEQNGQLVHPFAEVRMDVYG